ncbi:SRPBCC family protein [Actinomadura kijaniata]|uniref:SRPBCC family protein n=1 Tax=Actinomadura kijaniata TaxID=46161 RepID=UPI003F1B55FD
MSPQPEQPEQPEQRPFAVKTLIAAPRAEVWRALTDPALIRHWFGWDHPGLEREIHLIFTELPTRTPPDRIAWDDGQLLELEPHPTGTLVRVRTRQRPTGGDDAHHAVREDWRSFLQQLRFLLECHPTGSRRTVRLTGSAAPGDVLDLVDAVDVRHRSRFQRVFVDTDDDLVVVSADRPLTDPGPAECAVTVSVHDLDPAAFARVRDRWTHRWQAVAKDPAVTG